MFTFFGNNKRKAVPADIVERAPQGTLNLQDFTRQYVEICSDI